MQHARLSIQHIRQRLRERRLPQIPYLFTSYALFDAYCLAVFPFHFLSLDLSPEELLCHQIALTLVYAYEAAEPDADLPHIVASFLEVREEWYARTRCRKIIDLKEKIICLYDAQLALPVTLMASEDMRWATGHDATILVESIATAIHLTCLQIYSLEGEDNQRKAPVLLDVSTSAFFDGLLSDPFVALNEPL